jgi:hypothetical protein
MTPASRPSLVSAILGSIGLQLCLVSFQGARAAEFGVNTYLLGLTLPLGGITPAPGIYFKDTFLFYNGGRQANGDVRADYSFAVNVATFAWFPEFTIFGAAPGFAATIPYVGASTDYAVRTIDSAGAQHYTDTTKATHGLGDTEFTALLGWHSGDNHWNVAVTAYTPTGSKAPPGIAATGLNRPAFDFRGSYTYLGSATGLEITAIAGATVNISNSLTQYRSGTEFHFEWALNQHLPSGLYAGVGGYIYRQLNPDGGPGALDGPLMSEAVAIGPLTGYTINIEGRKLYLAARWFYEVHARDRPRGNVLFGSLTFKL